MILSAAMTVLAAAGTPQDWTLQTGLFAQSEIIRDQSTLEDGSLLLVGSFFDFNDEGIYAASVRPDGELAWELKLQPSAYMQRGWKGIPTPDGGAILLALSQGVYGGPASTLAPWVLRIDGQGSVIWSSLGTFTPNLDMDTACLQGGLLPDGRIVVVGASASWPTNETRYVLTVSPEGQLLSTGSFPPILGGWYSYTSMEDSCATPDGGFVVAGSTGPYPSVPYIWRFDANGTPSLPRLYDNASYATTATSIELCADGGYLLSGAAFGSPSRASLLRTEPNGDLRWAQQLSGPGGLYIEGRGSAELPNGDILMLQTLGSAIAANDVHSDLVRFSPQGVEIDRNTVPGGSYATCMTEIYVFGGTGTESYSLAGSRNDQGPCQPVDLWVVAQGVPAPGSGTGGTPPTGVRTDTAFPLTVPRK